MNYYAANTWEYLESGFKFYIDEALRHIVIAPDVTTLDIKLDVYKAIKTWYALYDNSKFLFPIRTIGGDATGNNQFAGDIYFLINNYRIVYDPTKVQVSGVLYSDDFDTPWLNVGTLDPVYPAVVSNLVLAVAPDLTAVATETAQATWDYPVVNITDNSTVGYQMIDHLHDLEYGGVVWVDSTGGTNGTTHPIGTKLVPADTFANAVIIANSLGITTIRVLEDATVLATDNISGFLIFGSHASKSQLTLTAGCTTTLTQFSNCHLTGTAGGEILVRDSVIDDLAGFEGILHQCAINGSVILAGAGSKSTHILSCYSGVPGGSAPEIDSNNLDIPLGIRDYSGGIKLVNKNGVASISIDLNSGQVIVDGTVTAGSILVRGVGKITDNGTATVDTTHLVQQSKLLTFAQYIGLS